VRLYHTIPNSLLGEVLSDGFPVSVPEAGGVRLTDRLPAGSESLDGQAWLLFDIPEEEVGQFEFDELGSTAREFAISPVVLNRYPILAVQKAQQLGAGPNGGPPALAGVSVRRRGIALGGVVVFLALGGYAAYSATRGDEEVSRPTEPRNAGRERPAAPSSSSRSTGNPTGSVAVGTPDHGHLIRGVPFPATGANHFTWDAANGRSPNPRFHRYGTDYVIRSVLKAVRRYRRRNSGAPRVGIGDLSLRHGGDLGSQSGSRNLAHQNGLDVAVLYPRSDGGESEAAIVEQVNRPLAQALLDELVTAGATRVSLDPRLGLTVPKGVAQVVSQQPRMHVGFRRP